MEIESVIQFKEMIKSNKILVDFSASWCGPCKMFSRVLEDVKGKINIPIIKVDIDKFEEISLEYDVMSIPTLIMFNNGIEVKRNIGFLNVDELIEFINVN